MSILSFSISQSFSTVVNASLSAVFWMAIFSVRLFNSCWKSVIEDSFSAISSFSFNSVVSASISAWIICRSRSLILANEVLYLSSTPKRSSNSLVLFSMSILSFSISQSFSTVVNAISFSLLSTSAFSCSMRDLLSSSSFSLPWSASVSSEVFTDWSKTESNSTFRLLYASTYWLYASNSWLYSKVLPSDQSFQSRQVCLYWSNSPVIVTIFSFNSSTSETPLSFWTSIESSSLSLRTVNIDSSSDVFDSFSFFKLLFSSNSSAILDEDSCTWSCMPSYSSPISSCIFFSSTSDFSKSWILSFPSNSFLLKFCISWFFSSISCLRSFIVLSLLKLMVAISFRRSVNSEINLVLSLSNSSKLFFVSTNNSESSL